ncbi:unnamed protein product [Caenorhabditis angaria]|uniref:Uncharacterized protein n=1 Tax=Caenorhabditis angaria TaxID=860376 RepID=A0A9P1ICG4_9PELO|nr:unnamed protein product [Caenorhabditis angaria]
MLAQTDDQNYFHSFSVCLLLKLLILYTFLPICTSKKTKNSLASSNNSSQETGSIHLSTQKSPARTPNQKSPDNMRKSTKSMKSSRNAMDSIKMIKGKMRKSKSPIFEKKEKDISRDGDDEQQHTEIIDVPIGKAAENVPLANNLTPTKQSKTRERPNSPSVSSAPKVSFAENLIESNNNRHLIEMPTQSAE